MRSVFQLKHVRITKKICFSKLLFLIIVCDFTWGHAIKLRLCNQHLFSSPSKTRSTSKNTFLVRLLCCYLTVYHECCTDIDIIKLTKIYSWNHIFWRIIKAKVLIPQCPHTARVLIHEPIFGFVRSWSSHIILSVCPFVRHKVLSRNVNLLSQFQVSLGFLSKHS